MESQNDNHIPQPINGITKFDFGPIKIIIQQNKIVVAPEGENRHLTFVFGNTKSGTIDIHETTVAPDGTKQHKTIYAIKEEDALRLLQEYSVEIINHLLSNKNLLHPVSLSWLRYRQIYLFPVPSKDDLPALSTRRGKKLIFSLQKYLDFLRNYPDRISDDSMFLLHKIKRRKGKYQTKFLGVLILKLNEKGNMMFRWFKTKDANRIVDKLKETLKVLGKKYGLPLDEHQQLLLGTEA